MNQIRMSRKDHRCGLRAGSPGRFVLGCCGGRRGRAGTGSVAVVVGVLAAFGVPGVGQPAALASSSSVLNWTKQSPATHPPARDGAAMAYDAATGTVVLFGGGTAPPRSTAPGSGTAPPGLNRPPRPARPPGRARRWPTTRPPAPWSCSAAQPQRPLPRRHLGLERLDLDPAAPRDQPARRGGASMAYDAATGTVVLFGGENGAATPSATPGSGTAPPGPSSPPRPARPPGPSRRWPTTRPPATWSCSAASQAAALGDTWVWNGSTWTQQAPRHQPARPGGARRWPTTRPPATWSCSAAATSTQRRFGRHLGLGRLDLDQAGTPRPARPPGTARRWPTMRPPATWSCSAARAALSRRHLDLGLWLVREAV